MRSLATLVFATLVGLLSAGCQSTSFRSAWFDTDFAGPPMRKVVVVGAMGSTAADRLVEDALAGRLRAAGVDAVSGHTLNITDPFSDASFASAVNDTGAQGLLLVRLLGVDTRTQVSTTMVSGGMVWGRNPWGGGAWVQPRVPVTQVTQYDLAAVETKVFDVRTRQVVWAATTDTLNPRSVEREVPAFADLVIGQLRARGVLAAR